MKNSLNLSIPKPCSEKWSNFTPTTNGGFCTSCSKTVVDFTAMSDADIVQFLQQKTDHTCGRFRADQLKTYSFSSAIKINPGVMLLKAGFLSLLFMLISRENHAKNILAKTSIEVVRRSAATIEKTTVVATDQIIKGIVKSNEDGLPLAGVNIYLKDSQEGTSSDEHGKFEFPRKLKEGDVLVFSFIGYSTQEYIIPKNFTAIEITMQYDSVVIMGDVAVGRPYGEKKSGLRRLVNKVKGLF